MHKKLIATLAVSMAFTLQNTMVFANENSIERRNVTSDLLQPFDKAWQLHFAKDYANITQSIPDPLLVTSQKVKQALAKHGYHNIDPDAVFYHRFDGAQSSHRTYNGWAHYEHPKQTYTVTQAVMLNAFSRYRDTFPDTINVDTGIYTQDASGQAFDERNEVRLLSSKLWDIAYYDLDIQSSYTQALKTFWANNTTRYTQLMRDSYAFSAYKQYQHGLLDQAQYQLAISLLNPTKIRDVDVYRFDVYGYDSTDILLIEAKNGQGGLMYIPGATQAFFAYRSERQLKKHLFKSLKSSAARKDMEKHFSLYLRQNGSSYSGVDVAINGFATGSWSEGYMMMKRHPVHGNVFARMTEQMKARLVSDGDTMIKSNQEAQRDYILSVAYSVMTLLPVVDVIAPEVGIPLNIALSTSQFGLSIDKAIFGDTLKERLEGTKMSSINAAIIGATTLLPALAQYGRSLAQATEIATEALPNTIVMNPGFPAQQLNDFTSMPQIVVHPQTGEELLGVRITNKSRGALLRSDGFSYYREVDPASGRLLEGKRVVRTVNPETGDIQFLENLGLRGGGDDLSNEVTPDVDVASSNGSERSDLPELLLPEDLPERPGIGGSGYADMGGRNDDALRDFYELESKVDPQAYLTDVNKLHEVNVAAQREIRNLPFYQTYDTELKGALVYRGDTRLPDEIFHSGFNRKIERIEYTQLAHHTRGIRGVISTTTDQGIAVNYALHNQRGYVYAIELNHGGKSVDTLLRDKSLSEVATLNIPPEDIMFAMGPFTGAETSYSTLLEDQQLRTAELLINPHATALPEVAQRAFEQMKATLKYPLSPEMSFRERYASRKDLFWHQDEAHLASSDTVH
ncbi:cytotoxic necrotizing factor [Vibrio pectenicida]|uniref:Cytotoxic necrotizing factor n=1 Tax=Vibrio pectenicida TaxID=62763 RepID=A0A7Y3ZX32_9VIBR|nr:DUF6543 domain-containing protein [Vibrio pectenicida]NOH70508.1 cytotoxic necrotizing factor [Vibrio pectenicida]